MASAQPVMQKPNFGVFCRKIPKSQLENISIEKHTLLNFLNLPTSFCPGL